MRGAAYLSGLDDAMVIDVGGTTTDVGQLSTAFRARPTPWSRSAACARCSACPIFCRSGWAAAAMSTLDPLKVGPLSVGYRLLQDGIAFGGTQLTTTDIAVAAGLLDLGDRASVAHLAEAT